MEAHAPHQRLSSPHPRFRAGVYSLEILFTRLAKGERPHGRCVG